LKSIVVELLVHWESANWFSHMRMELICNPFCFRNLLAGGYPLDWGEKCLVDPFGSDELPLGDALPASWAAAFILHHLQCVSSNAHAFTVDRFIEPKTEPGNDDAPGVDLTQFSPVELGSCLYPVLSLMNHSCDPNVALIFMRDGVCGVFALRPIPKGDVLYGNYGVHYATHDLAERQDLLQSQYHFRCTCPACVENWSRINCDSMRLICQHCKLPFTMGKPLKSGQCSKHCNCSTSVRSRTLLRFDKLVQKDLQEKTNSIPAEFLTLRSHQIKPTLVKRHLTCLTEMLDNSHLGGLLLRPALPFDWVQELIKTLLGLCYGYGYAENAEIHLS
uniref:SET domain-containing protein n=1 Tax=Echinostoma caproni TaxID=27848 RepID=A0A183B8M6_9TREM